MKDICRVFDAIKEGCETSNAVAAALGISVASASAHISELIDQGLVRRQRRAPVKFSRKGRESYLVRVTT